MKNITCIPIVLLVIFLAGCSAEPIGGEDADWKLNVDIRNMQGLSAATTRVVYSGLNGEHSEFETGDCFGLFVFGAEDNDLLARNMKVYCSGLDNSGNTVWSIYKEGASAENSSNYPLSEILSRGTRYFAYYPYNPANDALLTIPTLQTIVSSFYTALPSDQSGGYTPYDLLVASNISGCEYGEVLLSGKTVSLTFAHVTGMLRFLIPTGSQKYDYLFGGADFTPYLMNTDSGLDEYRYLFKPGCILDFCLKYVHDGKLYRVETGNAKNIWPVRTEAGHCYMPDENHQKVPHSIGVDMGTSVMWASFNLGAEDEPTATAGNISSFLGYWFMWGVNKVTDAVGNPAFTNYNNSFTGGTKPKDLPAGYDYSGDPLYDAARAIWGGEWRTPTLAEWQELYSACTCTVTNNTSIRFTSKTTGNSIDLFYAGYNNGSGASQPNRGYYWSSTSHATNILKANSTFFNESSNTPSINSSADRYTGLPIRPVYTK
ncbi:MAG: hypothetical protein PUF62_11865 [Bacteroidales bacterium]|nr:hypothetical protein [Bacteroidales bacterium]